MIWILLSVAVVAMSGGLLVGFTMGLRYAAARADLRRPPAPHEALAREARGERPPRRRTIGPSRAERQRDRRAEDRDMPVFPRKADCPGCGAGRDADPESRWPVGDCGPACLRRAARRSA